MNNKELHGDNDNQELSSENVAGIELGAYFSPGQLNELRQLAGTVISQEHVDSFLASRVALFDQTAIDSSERELGLKTYILKDIANLQSPPAT